MEPTKTCLFKTPKHFMSEFMIELCEVTLNPKQQTWVQRENKAMERKIKEKNKKRRHICDMITYANLIKHNIILFGMFSNIAKHQIALTEQNKNKKEK